MNNIAICLLSGGEFLQIDITGVGKAGLVVGLTGLIIGILLGIAGKRFAVEVDERVSRVREYLPGSNCGGCGFAGCDALAEAIVQGKAPVNACAGADHAGIAAVMGVAAEERERRVAFVRCRGTCDKTEVKYRYHGIADCRKLMLIPGKGEKVCSFGCAGYGSCTHACKFDAIHVINGVATVDESKCTGCSACIKACPNGIIELVLASAKYRVACSTKLKGREVKAACETGCIGCGICVKQCGSGAIEITDNLAHIDYEKCTGCGKCAEKCPQKIIRIS